MPPAGEGSAEPSPKVKSEGNKEETGESKEGKEKEKKEEKKEKEAMAKYAALRGSLVKQIHQLVKSANKK